MVPSEVCSRKSINTDWILKYFVQFHYGCATSLLASTSLRVKWKNHSCLFCMAGKTMWKSNRLLQISYSDCFRIITQGHDNNHELGWFQAWAHNISLVSALLYTARNGSFSTVFTWIIGRSVAWEGNNGVFNCGERNNAESTDWMLHCLRTGQWSEKLFGREIIRQSLV